MSDLEFLSPDRAVAEMGFTPVARSCFGQHLRELGAEFERRDGWLVAGRIPRQSTYALAVRDISHSAKIEVRGSVAPVDGTDVIPLGPDRTLVVCEYRRGAEVRAALQKSARVVVDQTAGLAGVGLEGPGAVTLMQRLTELDLHRLPAVGALARIRAIVVRDGQEAFRVYVDQQYGHYLWKVVVDAAHPLGGGPSA